MAASVTYVIEADFDGDGVYETDLTPYASARAGGLRLSRGLNQRGVYQAAQLTLGLDNRSGLFTPGNSASPLYGKLEPDVAVRVRAVHNAISYTLAVCYIQDTEAKWEASRPAGGIVTYDCADLAQYLESYGAVNVITSTGRDTDAAIAAILDQMGLAAGLRSLADGVQDLPFHFVAGADALTAIMDCVASEMGGRLYVSKGGQLVFEGRNARLGLTVDRTWGDGTAITPRAVRYEANDAEVLDQVEVQATVFQRDQLAQEVFRFTRGMHNNPPDSLHLAAGAVYEADFYYDTAVIALNTPVARVDYLANAAVDGSGADRTGDLTVTVTDKGGRATVKLAAGQDLYVTAFRLTATVVNLLNERPVFISAKSTPLGPVNKVATFSVPWADDTGMKARDYSMALLRTHRYPVPRLTLSFLLERNDATAADLLAVEISDLVRYKDTARGVAHGAMVDDWWYVDAISYDIGVGRATEVTVTLTPSYAYRDLDKIAYDSFTRPNAVGSLGTALSGQVWQNDGAWDIAGNKAQAQAGGERLAWLALGAADCVVECDLEGLNGGSGSEALGVAYRLADTANHWTVQAYQLDNKVYLVKRVAGVSTTVGQASVSWGARHEVRVIAQGSRHRVWWDRKLVMDVTDGALAGNTGVGLYANAVTAGRTHDDFYAQGL